MWGERHLLGLRMLLLLEQDGGLEAQLALELAAVGLQLGDDGVALDDLIRRELELLLQLAVVVLVQPEGVLQSGTSEHAPLSRRKPPPRTELGAPLWCAVVVSGAGQAPGLLTST